MLRFVCRVLLPTAALSMLLGSGALTAGVFDFIKSGGTKFKGMVARGQEPNPAPPAPLDAVDDPAYNDPVMPAPAAPQAVATPLFLDPPGTDCAPSYSGLSDCNSCPLGAGCREPNGCSEKMVVKHTKSMRKIHGDSWYCDSYPLFGPRYGYHNTCWRRLPEDCRCPIYLPPRKSARVSQPIPKEPAEAKPDEVPPPPQALNFR